MTTADLFLTLETIDTVKSNYMGLSDSDKNILTATELLIQNQLKERQNMGVEYETIRI